MALSIVTTPTLTVNVGSQFSYTLSAIETHPDWSGTSAITHVQVSAVRGPVSFDSRFVVTSGTNATCSVTWYPRVSDVVTSASGVESVDLTISVYGTSANFVNQDLSISADFSTLYKRKTNIGTGTRTNNGGDIEDFYMRGLGSRG